jgi:hypothetical protein
VHIFPREETLAEQILSEGRNVRTDGTGRYVLNNPGYVINQDAAGDCLRILERIPAENTS